MSITECRYRAALCAPNGGTVKATQPPLAVTYEQHVVTAPAGAFQPLSRADRASLAAALASYLHAHPGAAPAWQALENILGSSLTEPG